MAAKLLELELPPAPPLPDVELAAEDDQNMETAWHWLCIQLLLDVVAQFLHGREDYYAGGNQFIYFDIEQARNRNFRGPDFYLVLGVPREPLRPYWCVWQEKGRYPNVIVELLSPTTAVLDLTVKKDTYEQTFRTPNYFCYDPESKKLQGWKLETGIYRPLAPNESGWLWCDQLGLWLGPWRGRARGYETTWLRWFDTDGRVVPSIHEFAAEERRAAELGRREAERIAAEAVAELEQLKARLTDEEQHENHP
jgi:Uma2 family endonuclease